MLKRIVFTVILLYSLKSFSQGVEMLNIEFSSLGSKDNGVGVTSSAISVKLPIKFHKGVLINGFSYSQKDLSYDSNAIINTSDIENFKSLKYSLSYMQRLNNRWAYIIMASPTISSNFESSLTMDDVLFNGGLIITRSNLKSEFNFGFIYNTTMGFSSPIPFISYNRKISNRLSYNLGFPLTKIDFKIDDRNKVNLHIKPKGFYSNISNNVVLSNSKIAEKVKYKSFIAGVNYMHTIDNYWKVFLDAGYQLSSDYDLLDGNKNSVYSIESKNGMYLGVSLKFNLFKKKNKIRKL